MAQWGNTDDAANSVLWAVSQLNKPANTDNQTNLFGNTTLSAFVTNQITGQYGVDVTEMGVGAGPLVDFVITFAGSGYSANATVTLTGGGGSSGVANGLASGGRITVGNISTRGSGYTSNPEVAISGPTAITFNGSSAVDATNNTIAIATANSRFLVNDYVLYKSVTGAVVAGLSNNTNYYISFSNSTVVALSTTKGGSNVDITGAGSSDTGHSLTGETATGFITVGGAKNKGVEHAGWVLRTVGTGGRAGRVQYETLVAMGSISTDASDDFPLPDA
jgi:hypothetical protein